MPLQPIPFEDFSQGVADRYVDTDVRRAANLDNLVIDEVAKLYVRNGSKIFDSYLPSSAGQKRPSGTYIGPAPFHQPVVVVGKSAFFANSTSGWTEIHGPATNAFLPNKTDTTLESSVIWRRQLVSCADVTGLPPTLIYCSASSPHTMRALTCGLPELASSPTTAATGSAWSGIYYFFYKYTYTDYLGTQFTFNGNPILVEVTNATGDPAAANISFTGIPALANTAQTNYDTVNVTVEIYRTVNGGQTGFFIDSIANGTTIYKDVLSDSDAQDRAPIYTAGGVLGWDQPPLGAKALTQTYDVFWYATSTTLYQSVAGNPGSCPNDFADDFEQQIIALSDVTSYPVVFCDMSVYRIEGTFDEFGNNGFQRREIHPTAGCIAPGSVIKTVQGIFWFGNGGVYWTNGFDTCMKISRHLDESYKVWANALSRAGFDPVQNCVTWTVSSTAGGQCDTILVLDLNQPLDQESCFYTRSSRNNLYPTSFAYSSSIDISNAGSPFNKFYKKQLFTDQRGYLLYFDPLSLTDPLIDTNYLPTAMAKKAIIYNFTTAGLNEGSVAIRKYTPEVTVEVEADTQFAMQIRHRRDDGGTWSGTGGTATSGITGSPGGGSSGSPGVPEMRQDGPITWNITDCAWLTDAIEHPWRSNPAYSKKSFVPYGQLRSERRQISFTNAFTNIQASDDASTATIALGVPPSRTTLTLDDVTKSWVDDTEGYYVTLVDDNYVQTYEVARRVSATVLELYDPYATLTNGSRKWVIKGFRKHERPRLMSFTLYVDSDGQSFTPSTTPAGANA